MILIAGFLAFNGGTLGTVAHAGDGATVAQVIANTVMGGAGGGIPVLFASKFGLIGSQRVWAFSVTVNATLTGMVTFSFNIMYKYFVFYSLNRFL